jgi:hypothetical protein
LYFLTILGILDLKAKSPVQYFIGCNGYYGCSFCTLKGIFKNNKHYFPSATGIEKIIIKILDTTQIRTKENTEEFIQKLKETEVSSVSKIINKFRQI